MNSTERRCPKCSDTGLTRADSAGLGFCFCDIGLDRYLAALHIALADVEADLKAGAL